MWLFLEAFDVWMFRDGKPFNAGEGHIANTIFPPSAHTIQGALRAFLLNTLDVNVQTYVRGNANTDIYALIGNPRDPDNLLGKMQLYGPFLARCNRDDRGAVLNYERYLPLPSDIVAAKDADLRYRTTPLKILRPMSEIVPTANRLLQALSIDADDEHLESFWIAESDFVEYLNGSRGQSLTVDHIVHEENLYVREYRSGNALRYDKRRVRSEESMLYSASFIRPQKDVGLLVWLTDEVVQRLPDEGCYRMGGEGRATRYKKIKGNTQVIPETPLVYGWQDRNRLKIVFLTPTYFSRGWLPQESWFTDYLVAAALGRSLNRGGWDLSQNRPRPIRHYVPPGSVYYFEFEDELYPDTLQLSEQPSEELPLLQLGYGHVAVGVW